MLKRGVAKAQNTLQNKRFPAQTIYKLVQLNILHLQSISLLHQLYPGVRAAEMMSLHPKLRLLELFSLRE
jgi:hypothetical protein